MNFGPIPPWRRLLRYLLAPSDTYWSDLVIRFLGPIALIIAITGMVVGFCLPAVGAEPTLAGYHYAPRIIDVPRWVLRGIAAVESSSYYVGDRIVYVDKRDGLAGEVGAFQLRRAALKDVGLLAHRSEIRRDPAFAEFAATLYLRLCYRQTGTWRAAIGLYHTGALGEATDGAAYYDAVCAAGTPRF